MEDFRVKLFSTQKNTTLFTPSDRDTKLYDVLTRSDTSLD